MKFSLFTLTCSLLAFNMAHASEGNQFDYLLSLDIESLKDIEVSSASKRLENISDAPGVVTVISAAEIEKYGGDNLYDIIRRAPNTDLIAIPLVPLGIGFSMRGQVPAGTPSHHLTLLDGRPVRESQLGGWDLAFYQSFPLESIERIEIIRGPGSVLYGTNAFSGVINVITKNAKEKPTKRVSAGYGSFNSKIGELTYRDSFETHDFSIHGAVKYFDSDGWDYNMTDALGSTQSDKASRSAHSKYVRADYKKFSLSAFSGDTDSVTHGIFSQWPFGEHKSIRHFVDIGYEHDINQNWKANFNVTYNGFENNLFKGATTLDRNRFIDMLYEASIQGSILDDLNLLAGMIYDERSGRLKVGDFATYDETINSAYLQMDYKPVDWLKLIGGFQLNKTEALEKAELSPRAGAIVSFSDECGVKLLYGEAFKTPTASETRLSIPAIIGNPDLKPETIETTDLQFFYNGGTASAALTGYVSTLKDSIRTGPNPNAPPFATFLNSASEVEYKGLEFEGKMVLSQHFDIMGSITYQYGEEDGGFENDVGLAPRFMAKIGGSYTSGNGITIGVFDNYVDDVLKYREDIGAAPRLNPEVKSTHLVSANINMDLNRLFDLPDSTPNTTFTVYGDNLLDEDIYVPELAGFTNTVPSPYGGRAVYAKITMEF